MQGFVLGPSWALDLDWAQMLGKVGEPKEQIFSWLWFRFDPALQQRMNFPRCSGTFPRISLSEEILPLQRLGTNPISSSIPSFVLSPPQGLRLNSMEPIWDGGTA